MSSRIWALCLVKNESDIIAHCLKEAQQWCEGIFIVDNGSTDGTWEIVQSLQNHIITPWKSINIPFTENLRRQPFDAFRHKAQNGDWWCRLDADEFYVESPREWLTQIPLRDHVVWGAAIEYYLTETDIATIDFTNSMDAILPLIKHYTIENSEPRFFRHRTNLTWTSQGWPDHMGIVSKNRILYRHYKYRSPKQIQARLSTRQEALKAGFKGWQHASVGTWQEKLRKPSDLHFDNGDGNFQINEESLPVHIDPFARKLVKRIMHGFGLWP